MGTPLILLTEDTAFAVPVVHGRTLVVHHHDYASPFDLAGKAMEFSEFKPRCRQLVRDLDSLVFVGLNKAMTPSNRTEDVWELLFNQTPKLRKVSVDNTLFVSEPWRAWFHFGLVGAQYRDYTYSYIAESHHKSHWDGLREDDPFALDELLHWSRGVVASGYRRWFKPLRVTAVPMPDGVKAEYASLKALAFDEESSVSRVIARLADFAASVCSARKVPAPHQLFRSRQHSVTVTDLPVDWWLVSWLQHLASLANGIAEGCYRGDG